MSKLASLAAFSAVLLVAACASQRDHFYTLGILPQGLRDPATPPTVHVLLSVQIPSLVDRAEMIINTTDNAVAVLDHERWAGSLSDQIFQTLARDIEERRADVLVADRGFGSKDLAAVSVRVDIVRMSATRGGMARMEAHWRIVDERAGEDTVGDASLEAPVNVTAFDSVARAYSQTLSGLADRLTAGIDPARAVATIDK